MVLTTDKSLLDVPDTYCNNLDIISSEGEIINILYDEKFYFAHIVFEPKNLTKRLVWGSGCFADWQGLDGMRILTLDLLNMKFNEFDLTQLKYFSELGSRLIKETDPQFSLDIDMSEDEKYITLKINDEEGLGRHDVTLIWTKNTWNPHSIICKN